MEYFNILRSPNLSTCYSPLDRLLQVVVVSEREVEEAGGRELQHEGL